MAVGNMPVWSLGVGDLPGVGEWTVGFYDVGEVEGVGETVPPPFVVPETKHKASKTVLRIFGKTETTASDMCCVSKTA